MTECKWMALVAEIKRCCIKPASLTPTQNTVYQRLLRELHHPGVVCMSGSVGAGKTFTAWVTARSIGARYLPTIHGLDHLKPLEVSKVVIDNAPTQATPLRRLLSRCELLGIESIALISAKPLDIPYPVITLTPPTSTDLEQVANQFHSHGFFSHYPMPTERSFWALLRAFSLDAATLTTEGTL